MKIIGSFEMEPFIKPIQLHTGENKLDADLNEYYGRMYGWGRLTVNIVNIYSTIEYAQLNYFVSYI